MGNELESTGQSLNRAKAKVLIADDDLALSNLLRTRLAQESLDVDLVHDGEQALQSGQTGQYDLLILDLNLPGMDGLSVLRKLRPLRPHLPVLILSGLSAIEERVSALDSGADDYLSKPFSFVELAARTRALLRRARGTPGRTIHIGDLLMDRDQLRVERGGRRVALSTKEFAVLECLMENAGRPVTRSMIMETVWNAPFDHHSNLVDVYVKYVRDKVDAGTSDKLIHTVRGVGYVIAQGRPLSSNTPATVIAAAAGSSLAAQTGGSWG
jgi:two-component system, OmpR family, copper resistance phosphate regulon response regulator CusR